MHSQPGRRSPLRVALRRTERTITRILAASLAIALGILMVLLEAGDLTDIPYVGFVLLLLGLAALAVLVVLGIPYLIIKLTRTGRFRRQVASTRPALRQWAAQRRLVERGDQPAEVLHVVDTLIRHARELEMPLSGSELDKVRYSDVITSDRDGVVVAAVTGLSAPVFTARLVAVKARREIPPITITDRHSDELWVAPRQKFESAHFNQRWRVIAEDRRYASAMVHNQVMELLVGAPLSVDRIDLGGPWAISWAAASAGPAEIEAHLKLLTRLSDEIPRFVLNDY